MSTPTDLPPVCDLPPVGTPWGAFTDFDRDRVPAGTVLGPPPWSLSSSKLTRDAGGAWRDDAGEVVAFPGNGRPILSYPVGSVVEHPSPATPPGQSFQPRYTAGGNKVFDNSKSLGCVIVAGGTAELDHAFAVRICDAFNAIEARAGERADLLDGRVRELEREVDANKRYIAQVRGERDGYLARIQDLEAVARARIATADTARTDVVHLQRTVEDLRRALSTAQRDRDNALAAVKERDAQAGLAARVAALEAQAGRARFVAPSIGVVERLGPHEPGYCALPEGWEWAGWWYPDGLGITSEGVTTNRWCRNILRVGPG